MSFSQPVYFLFAAYKKKEKKNRQAAGHGLKWKIKWNGTEILV